MDPTIVARIARWAGLPGVTFEQIAEGESSWEPGAIQKPGGAGTPNNGFGLWQITTPPANGPDMVDAVKRLGGWMQMLNPFKNARMAKWLYDRGGMSHWYGTRYWDGRVHDYNRGGGVDSVPANLTPGEHVWTADEVSNAGGQSAMYAMRQNFQSGGAVDSGSAQRASTQVTNIAGVTAALRYMASHTASATAANISSTVRQFQQVYLPSLLNALQDITNSLARWVTNSTYAFRNGALVVKRAAMTETGLAKLTVESLATQMAGATQVVTALSAQVGDLKRIVAHAKGKAKDTANAALKGTEKELEAAREAQAQVLASYADAYRALQQAQIDDINNHFSRINSKLSSQQGIAQASGNLGALPGIDDQIMASIREQMADLKKRLPGLKNNPALRRQVAEQLDGLESQLATTAAQKIQDQITIVNNRAGNAAALIGAIQTATGAQGNTGVQAGLDQAMVSVMQGQISSLQQILTTMDPNSAAAQQLQQQIWGLQAQVVSTTVKGVQDMIADTENRYNNVLSGLATQAGYVALLQQAGNPRAAAALQVSNLGAQNSALGGQRAEYMAEQYAAGLAGDQGDWQQLGQKIAALDLTIAQNTQAIHDSMANLAQSLDSLAGSIEGTQSGAVSGGVSYLQQYGKLNNVNTSAAQLALLQSGTVGLNTQRGGINGAIAALLQDPGIQQAGLSGMVGALANAQGPAVFSQIAALMSSAGINMLDPAELASLQQVVSSLETNTQGTLDNTQAIMQLNGTINQPQTFTSTLFTNYRDALFNGMGGLMPGYARALGTNVLGTVQAGSLSSNSTTGDTIVNVNLTNPTETTDPLLVGRTAAWALKTP
jgi:hypothetical protein